MNKQKSNLDEMQEQKLSKIERDGAWFLFWALLAAIIIQMILGGKDVWRTIAAEWIIFMCFCVYIVIACIKNGIWDRKLKPTRKTNILVSLIAGVVCGLIFFVSSYLNYDDLLSAVITGIFLFAGVFALSLAALAVCTALYKKRLSRLESAADDAEETR